MRKFLFAALVGVAVQASAANAADMIDEATYDWSGLYAGVNGGYAFGGSDEVGLFPGGNIGDLSLNGVFGGIGLGYNYQIDQIVLGAETDIQLSGISDSDNSGVIRMSDDVNYFGTLRGRAGFAFDRTLIYATGGLAYGGFDYKVKGGGADIDENLSRWGYTVGAGIEHAFDDSWSVKAEYLYANFGSEKLNDGVNRTVASPDFHLVRVGLNYSF